MNSTELKHLLVCPNCKNRVQIHKDQGYCLRCRIRLRRINGIWHCLNKLSSTSLNSMKKYDELFTQGFTGPTDGSYEILAAIARGNRCVDIACGTGLIESLYPAVVGVDFSITALSQAQKNGARYLVYADAHALPFKDNAFEIALSAGNLEHFENPEQALSEMSRISRIQILIVHRFPPLPFANLLYRLITKLFRIQHQPIERPFTQKKLEQLFAKVNLRVVFKGVWTLPFNYGRVIKWLPELAIFPSAWFIISVKK